MKKILIPIFIIVAAVLAFELCKEEPNLYIKTGGIAVLMFVLYRLNAKVPSKFNKEESEENEKPD